MRRWNACLPLIAMSLLQACTSAEPEAMRATIARGEIRPVTEGIAMAEARYLGRVIEAQLEPRGLAWTYEITFLPPQGAPFEVTLDGRTGAFLGAESLVQERGR